MFRRLMIFLSMFHIGSSGRKLNRQFANLKFKNFRMHVHPESLNNFLICHMYQPDFFFLKQKCLCFRCSSKILVCNTVMLKVAY
jgi:hypothetical protein